MVDIISLSISHFNLDPNCHDHANDWSKIFIFFFYNHKLIYLHILLIWVFDEIKFFPDYLKNC